MSGKFKFRKVEGDLEAILEQPKTLLRFSKALLEYSSNGTPMKGETGFYEATVGDENAAVEFTDGTVSLRISLEFSETILVSASLKNLSGNKLSIVNMTLVFSAAGLGPAADKGYSFFRNGYQSWTESRAFHAGESARVPVFKFLNVIQDNTINLPSGKPGEFASEMFAIIANLETGGCLLFGQTAPCRHFTYFRARFADGPGSPPALEVVHDTGGKQLPPGAGLQFDGLFIKPGVRPESLLKDYFSTLPKNGMRDDEPPDGWCSWYQYFAKVTAKDVHKNLDIASKRGVQWKFFLLDDGYPSKIGDWLETNNRFPDGLGSTAAAITEKGMSPGVWLAPFIARRNSMLFSDHPDWFLRDGKGGPAFAGWNPAWGIGGTFYGLDTTHPIFRAWLRMVIDRLVNGYGFRHLKLDFLYGASLPGNGYDPHPTPAERLASGLDLIRDTAGADTILIGCGCPLGPAIGRVDAMRIGPDVAPYWFAKYRYGLARDPHAACTKFAIRNILTRGMMNRRLWFNDPDCMMLRESDTRLSRDERLSLINAVIATGGMPTVSDDLSLYDDKTWKLASRIFELARICGRGEAWTLDLVEREFPAFCFNTAGYLAVFNMEDIPGRRTINLSERLNGMIAPGAALENVWTGEVLRLESGALDAGTLSPRSSLLFKV